jgi:hypothetical protein
VLFFQKFTFYLIYIVLCGGWFIRDKSVKFLFVLFLLIHILKKWIRCNIKCSRRFIWFWFKKCVLWIKSCLCGSSVYIKFTRLVLFEIWRWRRQINAWSWYKLFDLGLWLVLCFHLKVRSIWWYILSPLFVSFNIGHSLLSLI